MDTILQIIRENWDWLIILTISLIWYVFHYIRTKRYSKIFDNDGNFDKKKYEKLIKSQKTKWNNHYKDINEVGDRDRWNFWI